MKIAVNTRLLIKGRLEGIGWYTFENLFRMAKNNPQHTFYFIFDRPYDSSFVFSSNVIPVVLHPQARHPLLYIIWFEFSVSKFLRKIKPDVFFTPDGYSVLNTKVPVLLTIHDINFEHNPKDFPFITYKYLKFFFPRFTAKAKIITTVSEFSKQDLIKTYSIPEEKIHVIHNGIREIFSPINDIEKEEIRKAVTNGNPYFLYIGALHARKNIINQLLAFDNFKTLLRSNIKYIIVGKKMWWSKEMQDCFNNLKHKDDVIFYGHAETEVLRKLYGAALALTFVSTFEGFGIPIIEAFRCGTAVITSNTSSMPEVAGDAALLVSPASVSDISLAMEKVASNEELRNDLIQKGYNRANEFSWDKSSKQLMNLIESVVY